MSVHTARVPRIQSPAEFIAMKKEGRRISMVTCYDAWSAKLLDKTDVDCLLVGDSVAMIVHGHETTLPATVEMMETHVAAVARGSRGKWIVGDLPFLSNRKGLETGMNAVERLMRAGAHSVKLEGIDGHEEFVKHVVQSGVPVMGHLGLTPQSVYALGGFKVQARSPEAAQHVLDQAKKLEDLGCYSVVLECVPESVGRAVSQALTIPTIGIGAGRSCDGQVLVLHDLAGYQTEFKPKFLRRFAEGGAALIESVNGYHRAVTSGTFPSESEVYSG